MPRLSRSHACFALAIAALLVAPLAARSATSTLQTPVTRTVDVREVLHGVEITDPYRWLEDKDSPETRAWIAEQNRFTEAHLGGRPGRDRVEERLARLLKVDALSLPHERGGRLFFTKRLPEQELAVIVTRRGPEGPDEVLVDPHPLSPDHTTSVSLLDVSDDGSLLAYGTRKGGEDEVTVTLLDVRTGKELPDRLPRARYFGVALEPGRRGFYYARFGKEGSRIFHHRMGQDPATDELVFGEGYGPEKIIVGSLAEDGRHLLITVYHGTGTDRSEVYVKDLVAGGPVRPIVNDVPAYFQPDIAGDHVYLRTNWNASNYRILAVDLRNPAREHWKEIVPAGSAVIDDVALAGGRIFVTYLEDVVSTLRVFEPGGKPVRTLAFPTLGTVGGIRGRWAGEEVFYSFSSFVVPPTIHRYRVAKGSQVAWWRASAPVASARYEVKQVWYASKDGTKIPMFLVHRKGMKLEGDAPVLLTGYGGFTLSQTPAYSALAAMWVEQGGVYALPSLRGGAEFGEVWHRAGMLERKQNTFDDFIAAAEWLVQQRYTKPERIAIRGGSNGGLLVGAAITQRPELFGAAVCGVPLLDMLRYHRFLVARFWIPEYGSADDPEQFRFLHAYSPYHRVRKGTAYPAVLFVTGDSDTRVDPLHARKMTALLQASTGSARPILLHYDTKLGHAGAKPVRKQIDDLAHEIVFLQWQLGWNADGASAAGSP